MAGSTILCENFGFESIRWLCGSVLSSSERLMPASGSEGMNHLEWAMT